MERVMATVKEYCPECGRGEWVYLTDEEITALKRNGERYISSQDFARAVEALSKEKNT
jgi:hypothetical protein